jgi:hypothetical protein
MRTKFAIYVNSISLIKNYNSKWYNQIPEFEYDVFSGTFFDIYIYDIRDYMLS